MEQTLLNIFPVQSKSYSGFFRISNNTIPYTLVLTNSLLMLRFIGIPFIKIPLTNVMSYKSIGNEWVVNQRVFNGIVIKYKEGEKIKERVITFFSKEKSLEFLKLFKKLI